MIQINSSKDSPFFADLFKSSININLLRSTYSLLIISILEKLHTYACPACHGHKLVKNTTYRRNVIDYRNGKVVNVVFYPVVLRCLECNTYHSVLPAFLCPHRSYTYRFMFSVYKYRILQKHSLGQCTNKFDISCATVKSICEEVSNFDPELRQLNPKELVFVSSAAAQTLTIPVECPQAADLLESSCEEEFHSFISSVLIAFGMPLFRLFKIVANHDLSYILNDFKNNGLGHKRFRFWSLL